MKLVYLFQLPHGKATSNLFMGYDNKPLPLNRNDYVATWVEESDEADAHILEYMWEKFNTDLPKNFAWHSMSVSDIIEIVNEETKVRRAYYCDRYGWRNITEEFER